jgi:predicted DNA-binding protein
MPHFCPTFAPMPGERKSALKKTSVYLERIQHEHLWVLAKRTGRTKSQLIREAIDIYEPAWSGDRSFALAAGFQRIDSDARPISEIPDRELLDGFGE